MSSNNLQLTIEFLLKNKEQLVELFKKLQQKYGIDLDTSGLESAFASLDNVAGKNIELTADGSQASAEADQVDSDVQSIPEEKKTTFVADAKQALEVGADLYLSYKAVIEVINQVKNVMSKFVEASNESENAETRLTTVLESTVQATEEQIAALESYATKLQKITSIEDDATIAGLSQLATFGLQTDSLKLLTPALQALAVATGGINITSDQMIQSANLLGKAFQEQTGALSRVGITFTEAQEEMLKMGTEEEKVNILTQIINQNFGNLAQEMATTYQGKVAQMNNTLGDMQESIGTLMKVALLPLVSLLAKLADAASGFLKSLTETSLETTIRELEELGANAESIFRLKRIGWKYELDDVNAKLKAAGIEYSNIEEISAQVELNERKKSAVLEQIVAEEVNLAEIQKNSTTKQLANIITYHGVYTSQDEAHIGLLKLQLDKLDEQNAKYIKNIENIQTAELLQAKINQDLSITNDELDKASGKKINVPVTLEIKDTEFKDDLSDKIDQEISDSIDKSIQQSIDAAIKLSESRLKIMSQMKVDELTLSEKYRAAELEQLRQDYDAKLALFNESSAEYQQLLDMKKTEEDQINADYDAQEIEKASAKYQAIRDIAFQAIDDVFNFKAERSVEDVDFEMELNAAQYEEKIRQIDEQIAAATREGESTKLLLLQKQKLERDYNKEQGKLEIERETATKSSTQRLAEALKAGIKAMIKAKAGEAAAWVFTEVMTKLPFPLNIPAAIAASGVVYAAGTAIANQFGSGGTVGGKKHSQGGTMIEAEAGEEIIKASRASKYRNVLKYINNAPEAEIDANINRLFPVTQDSSPKTRFAEGGTVTESASANTSGLSDLIFRLIEIQKATLDTLRAFNLNYVESESKKKSPESELELDMINLIIRIDATRVGMVNNGYTGYIDRFLAEVLTSNKLRTLVSL